MAGPQTPSAPFRHLLVCANPSTHSFDHAIVNTYAETARGYGHGVEVRDLYALGFDPVLRDEERPGTGAWTPSADVAAELDLLNAADILVLVYPIWYGLPPAMLKGYVDRVLGANHSFRKVADNRTQSPLAGKPLLSFSTSGLSHVWLHARGQDDSLRAVFDAYLMRAFGMRRSDHVAIDEIVPNMSEHHAAAQLERVRAAARQVCDMPARADA
ncbi:NAD(P)H-dependent oxidoreductase [Sphingomonas sp. NFR15]|uniref:NAD(P)H-dependent oxidoreductase n=1 Tax=Sphingomonas sp. NFR15 TaxID=1566282 RepID=UPI000886ED7F|nr:NAD(P)H-dependent oxidoreductase [Sphingomonas sp. NFR15]SDA16544.1 NAD(P)H dehydrogenase (quinone) [Sphingomonas sp. NFR15]